MKTDQPGRQALQAMHRDDDATCFGKLDRVVEQIGNDLRQAQRITDDRQRKIFGQAHVDAQALGRRQ